MAEKKNDSGALFVLLGVIAGQTAIGLVVHYALYETVLACKNEYPMGFGAILLVTQVPAMVFLVRRFKKAYSLPLIACLTALWVALILDIQNSSPCDKCMEPRIARWLKVPHCP